MVSLKQRLRNGEQVLGTMVATFASPRHRQDPQKLRL